MRLGIAKKIKNGACRIVLDKAEEARIVAFSAFQSLGFDIAQFPQPTVSALNGNPIGVMGMTGNISTAKSLENASAMVSIEESKKSDKTVGRDISINKMASALMSSAAVDLSGVLPDGAQKTSVQAEVPILVSNVKGANIVPSVPLNRSDDENKTLSDNHDQDAQTQLSRENTHPLLMDWVPDKGPTRAVNSSGGLDSFLDLWDAVKEFYFDLHYSKRKEMDSCGQFEIHGFAICWENSPVYYVDVPRDLFCKKKCNHVSTGSSTDADSCWLPQHWSDSVKVRWRRIGEIMGKVGVRKFTWNLKVQIQVLRNCSISIQKMGLTSDTRKDMGLQLVDSSYFLLPSVNVKEGIDMCVVAWILWPDEERSSNPKLEKVNHSRHVQFKENLLCFNFYGLISILELR